MKGEETDRRTAKPYHPLLLSSAEQCWQHVYSESDPLHTFYCSVYVLVWNSIITNINKQQGQPLKLSLSSMIYCTLLAHSLLKSMGSLKSLYKNCDTSPPLKKPHTTRHHPSPSLSPHPSPYPQPHYISEMGRTAGLLWEKNPSHKMNRWRDILCTFYIWGLKL